MKYDFDSVVKRRGTNSYKWDTPETDDILPMWVADMDFRTAPAIIDALQQRVAHGIFGYTKVPCEYYSATIDWFAARHGWHGMKLEWFIYTSGVVPAVSAIIKAMTQPGDKVLLQTPAYNCFYSSIRNNDCVMQANPLLYDNGHYSINFDQLEELAADERAKVLILCNPHNPSGRVWTRRELERIDDICRRNGVFVIADEIHCELTYEGHDYTPYGSLGADIMERCAVCISPSKSFNIAGLQIASIVTASDSARRRIDRAININEVCDVNPFGVIATIAAYRHGADWLDELRQYLWDNYSLLRQRFKEELPAFTVVPLEGTYLAWVDCSRATISADEIVARLLDEEKLMVNSGTLYGPGGENFMRINLALPRCQLADAIERMVRVCRSVTRP